MGEIVQGAVLAQNDHILDAAAVFAGKIDARLKGYDLTDLIDTDDNGYGFEDEAIYTEEVIVKCERGEE